MTLANVTLSGSYDPLLVALSVLIAMFAAYAALDLASRVTTASGWMHLIWLAGGATAMGFGIWSMHYTGMLAYRLPVPVSYNWPTVLLSLLAAIFASAIALYTVSRMEMDPVHVLSGSVIMGLGIAAMHYIGMAAMRMPYLCRYDLRLVTLSVVLAIAISGAALLVAFHFRKDTSGISWKRIGGAIALGAAIPVMHYTGMAAASFVPSAVPFDTTHAVSISTLGTAGISIVTLIVLSMAVVSSMVDRRFCAQALELASSERRYRQLFERSLAGVYRSTLGGHILECNDAYSRILGYCSREDQFAHAERDIYLSTVDREAFIAALKERKTLTSFERCLRRRDSVPIWVLENVTLVEGQDAEIPLVDGTVIDITERKRAETELRQANALLEARQREVEEDLLLATRVQKSLTPTSLIWGGVSVETFYRPVRTIGGDFGLVAPRADCLNVLVCDVSGHGITSALIANRIYAETMSQLNSGAGLDAMMRHLNRFVMRNLGSSDFYFTLVAACVNRDGRSLEFAGAGHPPAMIVQPGQMPRMLHSRSAVLGLLEDAVNQDSTIEVPLQAGDRMVIYTDGFTESFNSQEEMLGVDGFSEIVRQTSMFSLPRMTQEIIDRVAAWRSGPATDDMSLVIVGIPYESKEYTMPRKPSGVCEA